MTYAKRLEDAFPIAIPSADEVGAAVFKIDQAYYARRIERELAACKKELETLRADAARYQWLRTANADLDGGFYVGDENDKLPEDITWVGSDLDVVIDAAIAAQGAKP
jgi:hypothetical protein